MNVCHLYFGLFNNAVSMAYMMQSNSKVTQPVIKWLVSCTKVMEYDCVCNRWHHYHIVRQSAQCQ